MFFPIWKKDSNTNELFDQKNIYTKYLDEKN